MQANWSLILNVLLLISVIVAIWRLMKARKQSLIRERYQPSLGASEKEAFGAQHYQDDIIAVRKIDVASSSDHEVEQNEALYRVKKTAERSSGPRLIAEDQNNELTIKVKPMPASTRATQPTSKRETGNTLMLFLLAKEKKQFAGYELLQTILAVGLRFGEGHLFHRHQFPNGQGPVLFSLAAATTTGVFDLQNIGAFSVRGLCLYMHWSKNSSIDSERLDVMLETAQQLSEGLDAYLLDDQRKPLTEERIAHYLQLVHKNHSQLESAG